QTNIINEGYRLHLVWYPLDKNQLAAQIELVLPSEQMTYLAGDTFIHTNKLRFKFGQVDPTYDHKDTLIYLLTQRIEDRYPSRLIKSIDLLEAKMSLLQGAGMVRHLVTLENNRVEEWRLDFRRTEKGWEPTTGGLEITKVVDEEEAELETVILTAREKLAGRDVDFDELAAFIGQEIIVNTRDSNNLRQGVLKDVSERGLLLAQSIGAGGVEVFFHADSVLSIALTSCQTYRVDALEEEVLRNAEVSTSAEQLIPSANSEDQDEPNPYQELLNHWVEIVDTKGRTRAGELIDISYYITIHVPMGAGSTKYHYQPKDIE